MSGDIARVVADQRDRAARKLRRLQKSPCVKRFSERLKDAAAA